MTGSIQTKKDYLYIVLQYKDRTGKTKRKWISTGLPARANKKKAEAMISETIEKYKSLECGENNELLVDYMQEWLDDKKTSIRQSTWETYEMYIRTHIMPYFAPLHKNLKELTARDIKSFYSSLLKEGANLHTGKSLCFRSIRKIASLLKTILNDAVAINLIPKNPAVNIKVPKPTDEDEFKGQFLTVEEAQNLLTAFHGHELEVLIYITLYYGLRRSEVVGLQWDAIDFDKNTIRIKHTVVNISTLVAADKTKSVSSRRTYPLLPEVRDALLRLKDRREQNKKKFGNTYYQSDYVFVWDDGKPFRPDCVSRSFKRVLIAHNIPLIRFHDLRHSTASILYDKGWKLKDIQEWLGHADIETTVHINYPHTSDYLKVKAA